MTDAEMDRILIEIERRNTESMFGGPIGYLLVERMIRERDAARELIRRVRDGKPSDLNDWNRDADAFLEATP